MKNHQNWASCARGHFHTSLLELGLVEGHCHPEFEVPPSLGIAWLLQAQQIVLENFQVLENVVVLAGVQLIVPVHVLTLDLCGVVGGGVGGVGGDSSPNGHA